MVSETQVLIGNIVAYIFLGLGGMLLILASYKRITEARLRTTKSKEREKE